MVGHGKNQMIIGLTGAMGGGKSEASKIFKKLGAFIIDADEIAHDITRKNQPALKELVAKFGVQILKKDGALERKKLAAIIFSSDDERKKAEKILHAHIISKIRALLDEMKKRPLIIIDAPLLFETSLDELCDKTVAIWTTDEIRIKRILKAAKFSRKEIEKRDGAQMRIDEKMRRADFIIDNSGSKNDLLKQIKKFIGEQK